MSACIYTERERKTEREKERKIEKISQVFRSNEGWNERKPDIVD
jgi:hypothetical protein